MSMTLIDFEARKQRLYLRRQEAEIAQIEAQTASMVFELELVKKDAVGDPEENTAIWKRDLQICNEQIIAIRKISVDHFQTMGTEGRKFNPVDIAALDEIRRIVVASVPSDTSDTAVDVAGEIEELKQEVIVWRESCHGVELDLDCRNYQFELIQAVLARQLDVWEGDGKVFGPNGHASCDIQFFNAIRGILTDQACDHPGCKSHVSHPCEGCGRQWGSTDDAFDTSDTGKEG